MRVYIYCCSDARRSLNVKFRMPKLKDEKGFKKVEQNKQLVSKYKIFLRGQLYKFEKP